MEKDYIEMRQEILDKGHPSPVPPEDIRAESQSGKVWYRPHFGVYHPKKPTRIRVVFDSSAEYSHVSWNKELLPGPDLMNSLLGVFIHFRSDIEQMFHSFHMDPNHREFLRFLWFEDNKPGNPIAEYIAWTCTSLVTAPVQLLTAKRSWERMPWSSFIAISTSITATQAILHTANLTLHKVVLNSIEVMEAFPLQDRGNGVRNLDLRCESLPAQRSLGVFWDLILGTTTSPFK